MTNLMARIPINRSISFVEHVYSSKVTLVLAVLSVYFCLQFIVPKIFVQQVSACPAPFFQADDAAAKVDDAKEIADQESASRSGKLISIALPITGATATAVKQTLQDLADQAPPTIRPDQRPLIFLEFDTDNGRTGSGSDLGACISLARFLTNSPELRRLQTVAYIPSKRIDTKLQGHAVLVAISANELVLDENASIGNAGIDERTIEPFVSEVYRGLAAERLVLPVPLVAAMLDPNEKLYRVVVDEKVVYVDDEELEKLEDAGETNDTVTLSKQNDTLLISSKQLHDYRLIDNPTESRTDLARRYGIEPASLEVDSTRGEKWNAVSSTMPPIIESGAVGWFKRSFSAEINRGKTNLIIIELVDCSGDEIACLQLAEYIAGIDSDSVRTVAFVNGEVRGAAGMIALACDHAIFSTNGTIGRRDESEEPRELDQDRIEQYQKTAQDLAKLKNRDWSVLMAVLDPSQKVDRYRNRDSGQIRLLGFAEHQALNDADKWLVLGPVDVAGGIDAKTAEETFLARTVVKDMQQVQTYYQLESEPRRMQPSATDRWIEKLATFLSSPAVSTFLLFGAVFFLMNEASAPGTGVMGFLGALCLLAFFWSQYLDGNVQGFEIVLLFGGIVFVLLEIFVIPGFGVFGIGGLLMIIAAIVLASQSFIIPLTADEIAQAPYSLLPIIGAGLGFFAGIYTLRKVLPNLPYFRQMMLEPHKREETGLESEDDPEAIVNWSYLEGRNGVAITRLMPSGKAKIDGRVYDVMTDGRVVDKGGSIEVAEATGNRVIVRPIEKES
jgi:membrane-bound ClpP family serine protease